MSNNYNSQRLQGAKEIIDTAKQYAKEAGILIDSYMWDYGNEIVDSERHTLSITSGQKKIENKFPDEDIADFPGGVNTKETKIKLIKMIHALVEDKR